MRDLSEIEELLVKFVEQLDEDNSILLAKEALNSGINHRSGSWFGLAPNSKC